MDIISLPEVDSTNSYVARNAASLKAPVMICAHTQTGGRGQRGNSWESEPGANLTLSILLRPKDFPASRQFAISEAFSLAVCDALTELGVEARVKWPNDIYVGDRKICGILIEHAVIGMSLMHTIAGAGINLNQREFLSDAPNPVSVVQLTGRETPIAAFARRFAEIAEARLDHCFSGEEARQAIHSEYMRRLWRADGSYYPFRDAATGLDFRARIAGVAPNGMLTLAEPSGQTRTYAFKEVAFLL